MSNIDYYRYLANRLQESYPQREAKNIARILLEDLTGLDHHRRKNVLTDAQIAQLDNALLSLNSGIPLQYVTGYADFYGLKLRVNKNVLIPRPETEELVHKVLEDHPGKSFRVLDIGTGSGCIALSIKSEHADYEVFASDVSVNALTLAEINCKELKLPVQLIRHDILKDEIRKLPAELDILISNPPYIGPEEAAGMDDRVVKHEPSLALFTPGSDSLIFYKKISEAGRQLLRAGAIIYFEIHEKHSDQVFEILQEQGYTEIQCLADMQGKARIVCARKL